MEKQELQEIETKWWDLMDLALEKKLCISLSKHINSNNSIVLLVNITPIDKNPKTLYSNFSLKDDTSLFYDCKKFVQQYN